MARPKDFSEWKIQDAKSAINKRLEEATGSIKAYEESYQFVERKNHWQNGDGWVGPGRDLPEPLRTEILEAVAQQFSPVDVISEAITRVKNGLTQREPEMFFAPMTPAEEGTQEAGEQTKATDDLREVVSVWWDKAKLWEHVKQALVRARYAGHGALRLWIAPTSLVEVDGDLSRPTASSLAEALEHIQLSAPEPAACHVYTDEDTSQQCGIVIYERDGKEIAELWYVDLETGETVLRVVGGKEETELRLQMGGRIPVIEMQDEILITEPVKRLQKKLNYENSLHLRSSETAGFPERYVANAEPEGDWLEVPPANGAAGGTMEQDGKTFYLHERERTLGASISTELRGIEGEDGRPVTPTVTFRDPTDPQYLSGAADYTRATILRTCRQGHVASEGTAEASGVAYQQARADFEADLGNSKGPLEALVRHTIEAAIAMAETMVVDGDTEYESVLDHYRCVINVFVNAGPLTSEQQRSIMEQHEKGIIALEDAMARLGVEDVAAAIARLETDPAIRLQRIKIRAEAMQALTNAGAGVAAAAQLVGFTEEEARLLARLEWDEEITQ